MLLLQLLLLLLLLLLLQMLLLMLLLLLMIGLRSRQGCSYSSCSGDLARSLLDRPEKVKYLCVAKQV